MSSIRLMFVMGTRPEAIKLAPVILEARNRKPVFDVTVVSTAQHREMLDDVLTTFGIQPDRDLDVMHPRQSLYHVTSDVIRKMERVIDDYDPDILVVQGDTNTCLAAGLSGFYAGKKVAHVEAGLRTGDKRMPFPEELNRRLTSVLTDYHFAPTERARRNLIEEGFDDDAIFVTGNTVIDALKQTLAAQHKAPDLMRMYESVFLGYPRIVLITGHRRENIGRPFDQIWKALRISALQNPEVAYVYPVHPNPNVRNHVEALLGDIKNFFLLPPLSYPEFCWLMKRSYLIVTDSGGIQEEAPALGKPVLVTREKTERPEAVDEGLVKLVGHDTKQLLTHIHLLLHDPSTYGAMSGGGSPYGDGKASGRILDILQLVSNVESEAACRGELQEESILI
ncbi:MAG: UDP-N-acetylglucosamine 2-epimerase (non-hydrolyzing) [Deltaproteobacteria bacterium]|nr:UDP-N-acetylglucosamine 2-epimerase (non-hydrolyzing) [Deltaproteobacteria bacterium]